MFRSSAGGAAHPHLYTGSADGNDDDAAIAAAIGASLDEHESLNKPQKGADNDSPLSTPHGSGSFASQDLALLTDAPLLPPADFAPRGNGSNNNSNRPSHSICGVGPGGQVYGPGSGNVRGWTGGAMFGEL